MSTATPVSVAPSTGDAARVPALFVSHGAPLVAMEAGADFIKTSTGKGYEGATLEAAYVMLQAIKVFHAESGKRVGIKLSGGISEIEAAHDYLVITKEILGDEWIKPEFFRIGASRLTNKVISKLLQKEDSYI